MRTASSRLVYDIQLLRKIVSWFVVEYVGRRLIAVYGMFVMTATLFIIGEIDTIQPDKATLQATIALISL
jgi:hypothetical protein